MKKDATSIYNRAKRNGISFVMDCSNTSSKRILENTVKANANIIKSLIKKFDEALYYSLGLNFFNPYHNYAYRSKCNKYLIYTHSSIEYIFEIL